MVAVRDDMLGVSSIREFAAPLMVGVICGAYSSVCITGALWLVMRQHIKKAGSAGSCRNQGCSSPRKNRIHRNRASQTSGKKNPDQPKKKNRKRVAERLAAQEAAAKEAAVKDEDQDK